MQAGQLAPTFRLEDQNGGFAVLIDLVRLGPLVISFHRGLWCRHCALALEALARVDAEIRAFGARHVAIGPPFSGRQDLPMPLLADPGARVARAYGLSAEIPATFVIDGNGLIVLAAIDPDYRNRLDPKDVLSALRCLSRR